MPLRCFPRDTRRPDRADSVPARGCPTWRHRPCLPHRSASPQTTSAAHRRRFSEHLRLPSSRPHRSSDRSRAAFCPESPDSSSRIPRFRRPRPRCISRCCFQECRADKRAVLSGVVVSDRSELRHIAPCLTEPAVDLVKLCLHQFGRGLCVSERHIAEHTRKSSLGRLYASTLSAMQACRFPALMFVCQPSVCGPVW